MRRLVDCTYLHSVTRCIRGGATHPDDVANFMRMVGEVLFADYLMFTSDRKGPVYGPTVKAVLEFEEAVGDSKFIKHFDVSLINHAAACDNAAQELASDLRTFGFIPHEVGSVSPEFEDTMVDPDAEFFGDLQAMVGSAREIPQVPEIMPVNVARWVLGHPTVVGALRDTHVLDHIPGAREFVRLTAAVRSMVYRQIAGQLRAPYLPATSRAKLFVTEKSVLENALGFLPNAQAATSSFTLGTSVDAIIRVSDGNPREILKKAWELRRKMLPLQRYLAPGLPGDAMTTSFKRVSQVKKLSKQFEGLLAGESGPSLMDAIEVQFIFMGIPVVNVQGGKFREWTSHRLALHRVGRFADLARDAKSLPPATAYKKLINAAGLKNDPPPTANITGDDRVARLR